MKLLSNRHLVRLAALLGIVAAMALATAGPASADPLNSTHRTFVSDLLGGCIYEDPSTPSSVLLGYSSPGTCTGYYSWKGNGDYTIRNTATGYCLTTTAAAGSSRPVTAALCSGSAYQEWSFGYSGDPANQKLVFHNLGNDWYLDAEGSTVVTSAGSSGNQKVFDQCLAGAGCSPAPN